MSATPPDADTFARAIFEAQPFSRFVGAHVVAVRADGIEIALELRPEHQQQHGSVHGGVLSYLADNAITFAGSLALEGDAVTSEFKINYLRPPRGTSLIIRAVARSAGRRQAVCTCEIFMLRGASEVLCASRKARLPAWRAQVD